MFNKFFRKKRPPTSDSRARALENSSTADLAAELLVAPTALMHENSPVAAKLMLAVALRIAARLRDNADKLKMYVQLTQVMQQEISHRAPG